MRPGLTQPPDEQEQPGEQNRDEIELPDDPEVVKAVSAAAIAITQDEFKPALVQALNSAEDISTGLAFVALGLVMGVVGKTQVPPDRLFGDSDSVAGHVLDKVSMFAQAIGIPVSREEYDAALEHLNGMAEKAQAGEQAPPDIQGQPPDAAPPDAQQPPTPPPQQPRPGLTGGPQ